jgi:heme/copper-type cytochrome/quinol oxidase subunit 1
MGVSYGKKGLEGELIPFVVSGVDYVVRQSVAVDLAVHPAHFCAHFSTS